MKNHEKPMNSISIVTHSPASAGARRWSWVMTPWVSKQPWPSASRWGWDGRSLAKLGALGGQQGSDGISLGSVWDQSWWFDLFIFIYILKNQIMCVLKSLIQILKYIRNASKKLIVCVILVDQFSHIRISDWCKMLGSTRAWKEVVGILACGVGFY